MSREKAPAPDSDTLLERTVLGCMILKDDACYRALMQHRLTVSHFASPQCQLVFRSISELYEEGQFLGHLDLVLLERHLADAGWYPIEVDLKFLLSLWEWVPTWTVIDQYARELEKLRVRRQLIIDTQLAQDALRSGDEEEARAILLKAGQQPIHKDVLMTRENQTDILQHQLEEESRVGVVAMPSGFARLDKIMGGLHTGRSYVIGGLPSVGKTALALQIGLASAEAGNPVWIFSKEMSHVDVRRRLLVQLTGIPLPPRAMRTLTAEQREIVVQGLSRLKQLPIQIDDRPSNLEEMKVQARALKGKISLFIVDHARLVTVPGTHTEYAAITAVSSACKQNFAMECEAACILLSQFNREAAKDVREEGKPKPHQLRGSGALEEDADAAMTLWRSSYMRTGTRETDRTAGLSLWKHRHGPCGEIPLEWDPKRARYLPALAAEAA